MFKHYEGLVFKHAKLKKPKRCKRIKNKCHKNFQGPEFEDVSFSFNVGLGSSVVQVAVEWK